MGWFNYDIIKQYINDNYKIAVETGKTELYAALTPLFQ